MGVPITSIALLLPIACVLRANLSMNGYDLILGTLIFCSIGFLTPIEIQKPNTTGKVLLSAIGLIEAFCVFFVGRTII